MIPVAPSPDDQISRAIRESIQIPPSVTRDGIQSGFSEPALRTSFLPPRGTRSRELALKELYFMDEMWMVRGAMTGLAKNIASLPWEIKALENETRPNPVFGRMASQQGWRLKRDDGVNYYQEVLRQANFGQGWGTFIAQTVVDFLRYDAGGYIEVIAAGEAFDAPNGPMTGLAHIDPLYTYPTGDPRYPAVYYDRWGGLHVLNHARVIRLLDMDDGDQRRPGYGDSALSRAVSIAMRQVWETRYINTRLDDVPPPGFTAVGGIMKADWEKEQAKYRNQQAMDGRATYGQRQFYFAADVSHMPKIESYDFSSAPEKFDFRVYTDIDVDALALAMGIDRMELMQLSGSGNIGSQGQSAVLSQKSRGKTLGYLLQQLERKLNDCLPDEYTFEFKTRDSQESLEDAQKAQAWSAVAVALVGAGAISGQEARTMMSNEIEAVSDALQDSVRGGDVIDQPVIAQDNTAGAAPVTPPVTPQGPDVRLNVDEEVKSVKKSYDVTESGFIQDVTDLLKSAITPNPYLDTRAFNITMRSFLKNYGYQAYRDGLAQGGVYVETLDPEDNADYMRIFVDQSQYVPNLGQDALVKKTITQSNLYSRANMWGKSLQAFLDGGMTNANKNAMYEWRYGLTEHCDDCLRLNGQVHRIRNWKARGLLPRASKLKCKGFNCKCQLVRTTETARGTF
jgi:hypothetical protein